MYEDLYCLVSFPWCVRDFKFRDSFFGAEDQSIKAKVRLQDLAKLRNISCISIDYVCGIFLFFLLQPMYKFVYPYLKCPLSTNIEQLFQEFINQFSFGMYFLKFARPSAEKHVWGGIKERETQRASWVNYAEEARDKRSF